MAVAAGRRRREEKAYVECLRNLNRWGRRVAAAAARTGRLEGGIGSDTGRVRLRGEVWGRY